MTRPLLAICVICSILFFLNLQSRDFWAPDEGDFALIVRELPDNHIVPHLNGKPYGEKPPLYYYIIYLSKAIFSWFRDEASLRLPSGFFAIIGALALFLTLYRFINNHQAILATCILISTPLYYWQARYLQADMVFAVFVSFSLLLFFWFYKTRKEYLIYLFFLSTSLAFLVKGPLATALIIPVVILFLFFEKSFRIIKIRQLAIGVLICLAVILPWYMAVYLKEGAPYLYENVIRQNFIRFFDAWSHKRPFYYYFKTLPLDVFPWSLFLPLGLVQAFKRFRSNGEMNFFLVWFVWMFFFLSLSSGKISKYMLPALPAIATIISLSFKIEENKYNKIVFACIIFLLFTMGMGLFFFKQDLYPEFLPERIIFGSLCCAFGMGLLLLRTRRIIYSFIAIFSFMIFSYTIGNAGNIFEKWNMHKSPRFISEQMKPYVQDCTPWVYYGSMRGVYVYYVQKKAIHVEEHDITGLKLVAQQISSFYILTKKRDLAEVHKALDKVDIVFEEKNHDSPMIFARYAR